VFDSRICGGVGIQQLLREIVKSPSSNNIFSVVCDVMLAAKGPNILHKASQFWNIKTKKKKQKKTVRERDEK
jgi:hypothetical protein